METKNNIGVLILAAGNSTRMGSPKFLLKFDEKRYFLQKIIDDYKSFGCQEIKVVLNNSGVQLLNKENLLEIDNKDIVINPHGTSERFFSIKLGLGKFSKVSSVFLHHVDNPFAEKNVLNELVKFNGEADYIVPCFNEQGGHPILVGEKIIESIKTSEKNDTHLKKFLNRYSRKEVSVQSNKILVNINTPNEYNNLLLGK